MHLRAATADERGYTMLRPYELPTHPHLAASCVLQAPPCRLNWTCLASLGWSGRRGCCGQQSILEPAPSWRQLCASWRRGWRAALRWQGSR